MPVEIVLLDLIPKMYTKSLRNNRTYNTIVTKSTKNLEYI